MPVAVRCQDERIANLQPTRELLITISGYAVPCADIRGSGLAREFGDDSTQPPTSPAEFFSLPVTDN